jgi:hypothetical protein
VPREKNREGKMGEERRPRANIRGGEWRGYGWKEEREEKKEEVKKPRSEDCEVGLSLQEKDKTFKADEQVATKCSVPLREQLLLQ